MFVSGPDFRGCGKLVERRARLQDPWACAANREGTSRAIIPLKPKYGLNGAPIFCCRFDKDFGGASPIGFNSDPAGSHADYLAPEVRVSMSPDDVLCDHPCLSAFTGCERWAIVSGMSPKEVPQ